MAGSKTSIRTKKSACIEERKADFVTTFKRGKTVLVLNGYFNKDTKETAADKMAKVLKAECGLRDIGCRIN